MSCLAIDAAYSGKKPIPTMPIYNSVLETIGRTPLIKLNRVTDGVDATILLKAEFFNRSAA